ncbi:hypothetical protein [Confluentibacter lentus]|uniref:hypothetical protein n=1 Tax=Confluentibacter lentus TaxID=1699412 RepID=UPI000C28EC78|nr:hypothetical protein [Confluentibacter lentus]
MSLIQDFEKLHITIKSSSLIILGQMPFFFVSIYLFNNRLIELVGEYPLYDLDFFYILSLCFCLSVTWFAMNLVLTFISFKFGDALFKDETDIGDIFKSSVIYSIGYLSVAIFINFKINFNFFNFLIIAYGFIVFRMIYIGAVWGFYSYKEKKKKNQQPTDTAK